MSDSLIESNLVKPEPSSAEQATSQAPKVQIRRTERAIKAKKPQPTFTVGELIPWKGVWFQLVNIVGDEGEVPHLVLRPKTE